MAESLQSCADPLSQSSLIVEGKLKDQLERRLAELKSEFQAGQQMVAEVEAKEASLRESLLRISGAIQVLDEELSRFADPVPAQ